MCIKMFDSIEECRDLLSGFTIHVPSLQVLGSNPSWVLIFFRTLSATQRGVDRQLYYLYLHHVLHSLFSTASLVDYPSGMIHSEFRVHLVTMFESYEDFQNLGLRIVPSILHSSATRDPVAQW